MASFEKAVEHMKRGHIAEITGWKYRIEKHSGLIQRMNGWWQLPTWPIADIEKASVKWRLRRTTKQPLGGEGL